MDDSPSGDHFEFAGDDAGAECAAHQVTNRSCIFGTDKVFERSRVFGNGTDNFGYSGVDANDVAFGVERKSTGRNIFQDSFDELTAAFEFADGFLEIVSKLVDLRARVAKLRGHTVEGTD